MSLVPRPVRRLDASLKSLVNSMLVEYDPYSTVKLALVLMTASKLLKAAQKAWMHRADGLNGLYQWLLSSIAPLLKKLPMVKNQLRGEMDKLRTDLHKDITKDITVPCIKLPPSGQAESSLLELMKSRQQLDTQYWMPGKITGAIYHGDKDYMGWIGQIYGMFACVAKDRTHDVSAAAVDAKVPNWISRRAGLRIRCT